MEVGFAGKVGNLDASEGAGVGLRGVFVVVDVETGTDCVGEKDALRREGKLKKKKKYDEEWEVDSTCLV